MTKDAVKSFTDPLRKIRGLESGTEKLVHNSTIAILVFLFFLLASKPLFGSPITCQLPKEYPGSTINYFTNFCYFGERQKGEYLKRVERGNGRGTITINVQTGTADYYMWVPLIPILHVAFCLLPAFFWKFIGLDCFHGADIVSCLEYFEGHKQDDDVLFNKSKWRSKKLVVQLQRWIEAKKSSRWGQSRTLCLYVIMKWFRLLVFVLQIWIMAKLFGSGNWGWGIADTWKILYGKERNPLEGEFTLIANCETQRFQMGALSNSTFSNINTVYARCILSANFINGKAFLILYWWFLFVSMLSLFSALHYTLVLFLPVYRRREMDGFVRTEEYYIERYGGPHPDLNLESSAPLDYLVEHLGNDGFLVVEMVHEMLHSFGCNELTNEMWKYMIVENSEDLEEVEQPEPKKQKESEEEHFFEEGDGDRHRGGKDVDSKADPKESQSLSMVTSDSETEPLIDPSIFKVMQT